LRSIAHQAASFGSLALGIDRRHLVVSRQRSELNATVVLQRAGTYQQRINLLLGKARKGRVNVTAGGRRRGSARWCCCGCRSAEQLRKRRPSPRPRPSRSTRYATTACGPCRRLIAFSYPSRSAAADLGDLPSSAPWGCSSQAVAAVASPKRLDAAAS